MAQDLTLKELPLFEDNTFRQRIRLILQDVADGIFVESQGTNTPEVWAARVALAKRVLKPGDSGIPDYFWALTLLAGTPSKNAINALPDNPTLSALNAAITDTMISTRLTNKWTEITAILA